MPIALRTAAGILGSREEAADIAQDVAIDVYKTAGSLRDPAAFDAWVQRIAVRRTMRVLRKQKDRQTVPLALALELKGLPENSTDRELAIAARAALIQAFAQLPDRQRVALALRYVRDLSDHEIAEAMGCRQGTVHSLLSRGRASLRRSPALRELVLDLEPLR